MGTAFMRGALSIIAVGMWAYLQWFLLQHPVLEQNRDLLLRMMGMLDAIVAGSVFSFWLGTSASSSRKTELMAQESHEERETRHTPADTK